MKMEMRRDKITVIAQKTVFDLLKLSDPAFLETLRVDLPQREMVRDLVHRQILGE